MTGIERLYKLSEDIGYKSLWSALMYGREDDWDCKEYDGKTLNGTLADIADQIGREADVETVRSDAMEAWEWVREHGGVDELTRMFQDADNRRVELCGALGIDLDKGWSEAMAAMRLRLMPEGCEWPRYDTGEPVPLVGAVADGLGHVHEVTSIEFCKGEVALHWNPDEPEECVWVGHGERVRCPAVPAGDGEPLEAGQTVWDTDAESDTPLTVVEVSSDLIRCEYTWKDGKTYRPCYPPSVLTHTKPERQNARFGPRTVAAFHREIAGGDSWERIEDDATLSPEVYCHRNGIDISQKDGTEIFLADTVEPMARDLVRRCRALAERERGE